MNKIKKLAQVAGCAAWCLVSGISVNIHAQQNPLDQTLHLLEQEKLTTNIYKAYFPSEAIARKTSITFHSELMESHLDKGYLILQLTDEQKALLKPFDYRFEPATEYLARRNIRLQASQNQLLESSSSSPELNIASIPGYSCYETVEESFSAAQSLATNHPTLVSFIDVGDSWEKSNALTGHDIKVLKLTNSTVTGKKPVLFINSAIHAREYTTAPLTLAFAKSLVNGYGTDADSSWLLDYHEIHIMLQTNPDGRKKAETGLSWRKNTNQNYCGSTSNARGADLNRNFTFSWNVTNGQGSSGNQCAATFRGPTAASEPEIQALENYVRSIFVDKRGPAPGDAAPADTSGIHLDIHSYSELILWPWGHTSQPAPNATALQTLGRKLAYFNGYYPQQSVGLYPTDGTSDNVSYGELGVAAFVFELGTSFFQNCSTYQNTILPDNLAALTYAAKVVRTPYITPAGPDITTLQINGQSGSATVAPGANGTLTATATDTRFSARNGAEATQRISTAEYYIDTPPWVAGATPVSMSAADGNFNSTSEGITAVISTQGLTHGQHTVFLRSQDASGTWGPVSAIFLNVSNTTPPDGNVLKNGVAKTGLSGSRHSTKFFTMQVPATATSLSFASSSGTGDLDMYVKFGGKPSLNDWQCRPYEPGNNETCTITDIKPGTYHIMLWGYSAYAGASLVGNYKEGTGTGQSFETTTNVNIPDNSSTGAVSPLNVSRTGNSGTVNVEVEIVHTYIGDLIVDLVAPDGSQFNLHRRAGGTANNINKSYRVNVGAVDSKGSWQLKVRDMARADTGYIDRFKITFP